MYKYILKYVNNIYNNNDRIRKNKNLNSFSFNILIQSFLLLSINGFDYISI